MKKYRLAKRNLFKLIKTAYNKTVATEIEVARPMYDKRQFFEAVFLTEVFPSSLCQ